MATDCVALVTPAVLEWARLRANMTWRYVADELDVYPQDIDAWEHGVSRPTVEQAERLAELYEVPFGAFYLHQPPTDWPTLEEQRENAAMIPAVWRWLHPGCALPESEGGHTPDYLDDEEASAGLLEEMAALKDAEGKARFVIWLDWEDDHWGCYLFDDLDHILEGSDPDRKRAILLAAYEASRV